MDRDRRMENGDGQRNRERNIEQVQVQDQGEVYIQREMNKKTDGDRGKNIPGTWKGAAEQGQRGRNRRSVTQTGINRGRNRDMNRRTAIKDREKDRHRERDIRRSENLLRAD